MEMVRSGGGARILVVGGVVSRAVALQELWNLVLILVCVVLSFVLITIIFYALYAI